MRGSSSSPNHTATSPPTTTGPVAGVDDDRLETARVAGRRDEPDAGEQLEGAVDRDVRHAGRVDPLANGVVVLGASVLELLTLDVDRRAGEEVVAAAVVEVQVGVDDDVDAGDVEVLFVERRESGIHVGDCRMELGHAGVDEHAPVGVVDDVHVDRHPRTVGEQVAHLDRRDRDGARNAHAGVPARTASICEKMATMPSSTPVASTCSMPACESKCVRIAITVPRRRARRW